MRNDTHALDPPKIPRRRDFCRFGLAGRGGRYAERANRRAFAEADTNHDGQLTLAEAEAGMPRVAANFNRIDADHSGTVTLAEIEALADR